jgi:hypothetical protein
MTNTDNVHKLELFIVRNSNEQFFRAKGYGGTGNSFIYMTSTLLRFMVR